MIDQYQGFLRELTQCRAQTLDFLRQDHYRALFTPPILAEGVYSYIERMGKAMRPALTLWSAGAVGGAERVAYALPAAAAFELFHTYSIVHDDIIDRDATRRGGPTVHRQFQQYALEQLALSAPEAAHFGISLGILAGDTQLCWCFAILTEYLLNQAIEPRVAAFIFKDFIHSLSLVMPVGELTDVLFAFTKPESLSAEQVLDMYYRKTGATFEVAARVGALIGANDLEEKREHVKNLAEFARRCGLAFQLYDDLLGIIGDSTLTKKPVGADIVEGKRTFPLLHAYQHADATQQRFLTHVLGNKETTPEQRAEVVDLMIRVGSVEFTRQTAQNQLEQAQQFLAQLPPSEYREWLSRWASYIVDRSG